MEDCSDFTTTYLQVQTVNRCYNTLGIVILLVWANFVPIGIKNMLVRAVYQNFGNTASEVITIGMQLAENILETVVILLIAALLWKNIPVKNLLPFKKTEKKKVFCCVALGLAAGSIITFLIMPLNAIFSAAGVDSLPPQIDFSGKGIYLFLIFLFYTIMPAVTEELIFRGALLQPLRKMGDGYAIILSALAFALCHGSISQTLLAFFMGIVFAEMDIRTNSLLPSMITHFLYNFTSIFFGYFSTVDLGHAIPLYVTTLTVFIAVGLLIYRSFRKKGIKLFTALREKSPIPQKLLTEFIVRNPIAICSLILSLFS